jgi:hypothetical protein
MRNAVWKFEIGNAGRHKDAVVMLPNDAKIVEFGYQVHPATGEAGWFLWAVVDLDALVAVARKFVVVATGSEWDANNHDHVLTTREPSGHVWHLLERRRA